MFLKISNRSQNPKIDYRFFETLFWLVFVCVIGGCFRFVLEMTQTKIFETRSDNSFDDNFEGNVEL